MARFILGILATLILLAPVGAHAQATSKVVATCGGQSYTAGTAQYPTMSTNGFACIGGTGAAADQVQGNVAASATDSGNPVKVGAKYNSTLPTYTDGQRTDFQVGQRGSLNVTLWPQDAATPISAGGNGSDGVSGNSNGLNTNSRNMVFNGSTWDLTRGDTGGQVAQFWALTGARWNYAAAASGIVNTTTAVTIKAAAGASVRNYITSCQLQTATLGGATEFAIRDGAAGTVLFRTQLQTAALPLLNIEFPSPLKGTANTLVEVVTLTAVTGGVYVNCQGFTGA
jgi:hypothetical protein